MSKLKSIQTTLEETFQHFNETKFNNELPEPIITIQTKAKTKSYGWCSIIPFWQNTKNEEEQYYEINISAEHLDRDIVDIIGTLIHEMVHLYNVHKGIQDCTKTGSHNEYFKAEAERVGLIVEKLKGKGFAHTTPSDALKAEIMALNIDEEVFCISRIEDVQSKKTVRKSSQINMVCSCGKKLKVKAEMNIICGDCGERFNVVEE